MTDDARRALEWLENAKSMPHGVLRNLDPLIVATIEAALRQPQLSDEQWEHVGRILSKHHRDTWHQGGLETFREANTSAAIATTIRAAREGR